MAESFPIRYEIQGGSSHVDLTVECSSGGQVVVDVLTASSLPQSPPFRLGRFAGSIDNRALEQLGDLARSTAGAPGDEPLRPAGSVARFLRVNDGPPLQVPAELVPYGLEETISDSAILALSTPTAAVEVGRVGSWFSIRSIGPEAFPILLFARDIPGYWVRVWRDDNATPEGRVWLEHDDVEALVEQGRIPEGAVLLESGESIELPLPPPGGSGETGDASGGFTFWRTGEGQERRQVAGTW